MYPLPSFCRSSSPAIPSRVASWWAVIHGLTKNTAAADDPGSRNGDNNCSAVPPPAERRSRNWPEQSLKRRDPLAESRAKDFPVLCTKKAKLKELGWLDLSLCKGKCLVPHCVVHSISSYTDSFHHDGVKGSNKLGSAPCFPFRVAAHSPMFNVSCSEVATAFLWQDWGNWNCLGHNLFPGFCSLGKLVPAFIRAHDVLQSRSQLGFFSKSKMALQWCKIFHPWSYCDGFIVVLLLPQHIFLFIDKGPTIHSFTMFSVF